ncbi:hypothetical protein ACA910_017921 [Epithemia clementina (nom. ined.)]
MTLQSTNVNVSFYRIVLLLALFLIPSMAVSCGYEHGSSHDALSETETNDSNVRVEIIDNHERGKTNIIATTNPTYSKECGFWLAPSAIQGAGLGMYAGRQLGENEDLQYLLGDPVIPIIDINLHNRNRNFKFLWDEYKWNGWTLGLGVEALTDVDGASPGFGSAANSFIPLVNVKLGNPRRDMAGLHRSTDPGAGAFTAYYDRRATTTRPIQAGEEFYLNYGEQWFKNRTESLGPVPLGQDLNRATRLVNDFMKLRTTLNHVSSAVFYNLWVTFIRQSVYVESRVFGSFNHDDKEEFLKMARAGSVKHLRIQQSTKSLEWLHKHGTCGDHLYGANSTLKQAGRGAFASRDLPKGTVVAQLPLIHITDRSILDMVHIKKGLNSPRPPQLLLNYCFGHPESTILLCPYGPVVNFVNHNQTRTNVKIKWADPARSNLEPHLLDLHMDLLDMEGDTAKLAFEMVATRTIHKDEEVFLDYGNAWEEAWQNHLKSWKPVKGAENHISKEELDRQMANHSLRTVFELIENPYPANIVLECHRFFWNSTNEWRSKSFKVIESELNQMFRKTRRGDWLKCDILRRNHTDGGVEVYDAVPATKGKGKVSYQKQSDLPRIAFRFGEKPYTSDMFLGNAFRHDIGIPDSIFPKAWRNNLQP